MIKCVKCKSENVKRTTDSNSGKGRVETVTCLDCGYDKNPKVFTRPSGTHGAMVFSEDDEKLSKYDLYRVKIIKAILDLFDTVNIRYFDQKVLEVRCIHRVNDSLADTTVLIPDHFGYSKNNYHNLGKAVYCSVCNTLYIDKFE